MGCVSSQPISISDQTFNPPEPKITTAEIITFKTKSAKVLEECLDSVTESSTINESEIIPVPDNGCLYPVNHNSRRNSLATNQRPVIELIPIVESVPIIEPNNMSWSKRRNSEKEKMSFAKFKTDQAKAELQKRCSLRTVVHSKCPTCGDLGPETSNQYYTFYLVVPSIVCKTKCRRCNVHFSFEYVGMVKSHADAVNLVLDEEL